MKIQIVIVILFLSILSVHSYGNADLTAIQKRNFILAKEELEAMLNGKKPLSYERAIFLIENAYKDNRMSYAAFQSILDNHTNHIKFLMALDIRKSKEKYQPTILHSAKQNTSERELAFTKLVANRAIFSYMKDSIIPIKWGDKIYITETTPLAYSTNDPMGTANWENTQITHLLDSSKGTCFALASLFKIFSERLHSEAYLSTAPSHIFIRHNDENDIPFNIELSNGSFPGSGTIETLTYTTNEATNNNIALRNLDLKQSIALCLIYLAKGYEQKFGNSIDNFLTECTETALVYDPLSLNAMLLKMELLQRKVIAKNRQIKDLQTDRDFQAFQQLISRLYKLGYREMPLQMKNLLVQSWANDTSVILVTKNHNQPKTNKQGIQSTRYASLSWGLFDEEIKFKPIERYGLIYFDVKTQKITQFAKEQSLYNDYNFDPVVFAMNVDPLAHMFPWQSPYAAFDNSPIWKNDPTGKSGVVVIDKQSKSVTIFSTMHFYGPNASMAISTQTAQNIQDDWNAAKGTTMIDGVQYNVQFSIQSNYITTNSELIKRSENFKQQDNFVYMGTKNPNGGSSGSVTNANKAFYDVNDLNGNHTEGHEYGHSLGLDHPADGDGHPLLDVSGLPASIMWPRNSKVTGVYAQPGTSVLDPAKRGVTQFDIDALGLDKLNFNSNGRANLGTAIGDFWGAAEESASNSVPQSAPSGGATVPTQSWEAAPGGGYLIH